MNQLVPRRPDRLNPTPRGILLQNGHVCRGRVVICFRKLVHSEREVGPGAHRKPIKAASPAEPVSRGHHRLLLFPVGRNHSLRRPRCQGRVRDVVPKFLEDLCCNPPLMQANGAVDTVPTELLSCFSAVNVALLRTVLPIGVSMAR